ncbi:MAG: hypothetical protein IKZ21_00780, partial [Clostridia bacterium]|nr:hypothetical protein [Clostridia bacterium]
MNSKKIFALLLALCLVVSLFAGCSKTEEVESETTPVESEATSVESEAEAWEGLDWDAIAEMDYDDASDAIYDYALGEYYEYYTKAKEETANMSKRYALMAIAEAKMLEAGVFAPLYGDGGNYAMSRVVPRSATTTSWGLDEYRWYTMLVTNEIITAEDRDAITAIWKEAADADTYFTEARAYLADKGYTLNDTYNYHRSDTMETWDVIATSYTSDSYFITCTYSGLLEYDVKNIQQYALATSWEVNEDDGDDVEQVRAAFLRLEHALGRDAGLGNHL